MRRPRRPSRHPRAGGSTSSERERWLRALAPDVVADEATETAAAERRTAHSSPVRSNTAPGKASVASPGTDLQPSPDSRQRPSMALALVTGGSRGIGRAIVERLARDGADVAFIYRRDEAAAADVATAVQALGRRAVPLKADLGDAPQLAAALDRLGDEPVAIFVANAAATAFRPLLETKPHHVEKTFAITIAAFLQIVQR